MKYSELITIGIPAYNEGRYLSATLNACLSQAKKVIVFDNASNDNTKDLVEEYMRNHNNLEYVRNETNEGQIASFWGTLSRAETPYFSWLGAHDAIPEQYVNIALPKLVESDAIGILSPIWNVDKETGRKISYVMHDFPEKLSLETAWERVMAIIAYYRETMMYGIFKTEALREGWIDESCLGTDHIYLASLAALGKIIYTTDTYRIMGQKLQETAEDSLNRWRTSLSANGVTPIQADYETMIQGQLEILRKVLPPEGGAMLLDKAEEILRYRFEKKTLWKRIKLSLKKRYIFKTKTLFEER